MKNNTINTAVKKPFYWLCCFILSCSVQLCSDNCCIKDIFDWCECSLRFSALRLTTQPNFEGVSYGSLYPIEESISVVQQVNATFDEYAWRNRKVKTHHKVGTNVSK